MSLCRLSTVGSLVVCLLGLAACGGGFGSGDQNEEGESETRTQRASSACSPGDPCGSGEICNYDECGEYVGSCEPLGSDDPTPEQCYEEGYEPVCGCNGRQYFNDCMAELSVPSFHEDVSECATPCEDGDECPDNHYCHFPTDADCSSEDSTGTCLPQPAGCPDPEVGDLGVCGCNGTEYESACQAHRDGASVGSGIPGLNCGDDDGFDLTDYCISDASCGSNEYCQKFGCNSDLGSCESVPSSCDLELAYPACGCDGAIYSSKCEAQLNGVTTTTLSSCLFQCTICNSSDNPPEYCHAGHLLGNDNDDSSGQTKATVVEGNGGSSEPDVTGDLYKWPPSSTPEDDEFSGDERRYAWVDTKKRAPSYSARTFSTSPSSDPNLYYDLYTGACRAGDRASVDSGQWYRIELRKAGYEPYFAYRRHEYDPASECHEVQEYGGYCSTTTCETPKTTHDLKCEDWGEFKMWEHDENRQKLPDLFPDRRAFAEGNGGRRLECVDLDPPEDDSDNDLTKSDAEIFGLRVRVSIANVGSGPFHVERPPIGTADDCPCPKGFKCVSSGDNEKCVAKSCNPDKSPSETVCPRDMTCRDVLGYQDERCALFKCDEDSDCAAHPTNGTCKGRGRCKESGDFCAQDVEVSQCRCQKFDETPDVCEPTTTQVIQRVARTDPWSKYPPRREDLDAELKHHEGHGHMHLGKVVEARLVDASGNQVGGKTNKISFNLYDVLPFDKEIQNEVQENSKKQWPEFAHLDQGITPGYKDKYKPSYEGQGIVVGTKNKVENQLTKGTKSERTYYIEVSVDPNREFIERTASNNIVRAKYEFPEWKNTKCDVDRRCNDWDIGDGKHHRICKKYLQWFCYDPEAEDSDHPLCDDVPEPERYIK